MPYRLTKIVTRTGDDGHTNLGKQRVPKDNILIEVLGTLDELNSTLGLCLSLGTPNNQLIVTALTQIQQDLFNIGGELYAPEHPVITTEKISRLEELINNWNTTLPPLKEFLLPGGNPASAACHLARTVCRRLERRLVTLHQQHPLANREILRYTNRLSDLLFVLARILAKDTHEQEVVWERSV
ncbi:MAG: ATP:cob(I)alamin adenosyltransferase [Gammaproteobacteria bacterium RIFCSPHIGHO2_12_FULL_41_20]|nr:MAG: ATP:cob(I)alamin adenosyltransferase [Gammaproteobacteria bacterium RIFCSPHIGHO2_12_FULL_41_20]